MKIYQLHKYGGEWEDQFDEIIGTYLYEARARDELAKAIAEDIINEECARHCDRCPYIGSWDEKDIAALVKKMKEYCSHSDIVYGKNNLMCNAYVPLYSYKNYFRIEEVEVIE